MSDHEAAPGFTRRSRANGTVIYYWIASEASPKAAGYEPKSVRLAGDEHQARARARVLTAELKAWLFKQDQRGPTFKGTIASLIDCYQRDEDSPYRGVKANTQRQYDESLRIIKAAVGERAIAVLTRKDFARWHRAFRYPQGEDGPDRLRRAAHAMKLLRILANYGASMRYAGCADTAMILSQMRFPLPAPRRMSLAFDQAKAIVETAITKGFPSIALAQALQFEFSLRQKDVIGEWTFEPSGGGISSDGRRWSGGVLWTDLSADGVLVKQTTKTAAVGQWRVADYPLLVRALAEFPAGTRVGPMVVSERTGLPYRDFAFQREWRVIANAVGVPTTVWNMDSRAGGITEADEAGAAPEDIRKHATHTSFQTTGRYIRESGQATARVAELRVKHREKAPKNES